MSQELSGHHQETNGLMKDVIQIGKSRAVEAKQFLGFIGCVEDQIERAAAITDYLHRFAHRMDCERTAVSINELIEELVALMTRLAYRRRIAFEKETPRRLAVYGYNPILFHYLLFCIIDSRMSCLDRNGICPNCYFFFRGAAPHKCVIKGRCLARRCC